MGVGLTGRCVLSCPRFYMGALKGTLQPPLQEEDPAVSMPPTDLRGLQAPQREDSLILSSSLAVRQRHKWGTWSPMVRSYLDWDGASLLQIIPSHRSRAPAVL